MIGDGEAFVEAFLMHETAPDANYDPVAAREYYLRTRKLKGRKKGKKGSENTEARAALSKTKSDKLKSAADSNKQTVSALRETASKRREEISNKLKTLLEDISAKQTTQQEVLAEKRTKELSDVADKLKAQLAALPPVSKNANAAGRSRLQQLRSEKIAKLKGDASTEMDTINKQARKDGLELNKAGDAFRTLGKNTAKVDSDKVAGDLKASVDNARKTYEGLRSSLNEKYKAEAAAKFGTDKG